MPLVDIEHRADFEDARPGSGEAHFGQHPGPVAKPNLMGDAGLDGVGKLDLAARHRMDFSPQRGDLDPGDSRRPALRLDARRCLEDKTLAQGAGPRRPYRRTIR